MTASSGQNCAGASLARCHTLEGRAPGRRWPCPGPAWPPCHADAATASHLRRPWAWPLRPSRAETICTCSAPGGQPLAAASAAECTPRAQVSSRPVTCAHPSLRRRPASHPACPAPAPLPGCSASDRTSSAHRTPLGTHTGPELERSWGPSAPRAGCPLCAGTTTHSSAKGTCGAATLTRVRICVGGELLAAQRIVGSSLRPGPDAVLAGRRRSAHEQPGQQQRQAGGAAQAHARQPRRGQQQRQQAPRPHLHMQELWPPTAGSCLDLAPLPAASGQPPCAWSLTSRRPARCVCVLCACRMQQLMPGRMLGSNACCTRRLPLPLQQRDCWR